METSLASDRAQRAHKPSSLDPTPWKHLWDHLGRSAKKTNCLTSKGAWLWRRGIPACAGTCSSECESPSCLVLTKQQQCRRESASLPWIRLRLTGLTGTPWPSRLFWGGESAPCLPARMTRQESCQLPFSCWSSSSLHKHTATTPTLYLASVDLTLLLSAGVVLEHNNKVTRNRFNRSCVFPCYGNQSQGPKSCPVTGILCAALS